MGGLGSLIPAFDALGSVVGAVKKAFGVLGASVIVIAKALLARIGALRDWVRNVFSAVLGVFKTLWNGGLRNFIITVIHDLKCIYLHIRALLAPVICVLEAVRDLWDEVFKKYIAPILNIIQEIRQVLFILELAHVKLAAELDHKLQAIEGEIIRVFLDVQVKINGILSLLEGIVDPRGRFNPLVYFNSFLHTLTGIAGSFSKLTGIKPRGYYDSELDSSIWKATPDGQKEFNEYVDSHHQSPPTPQFNKLVESAYHETFKSPSPVYPDFPIFG